MKKLYSSVIMLATLVALFSCQNGNIFKQTIYVERDGANLWIVGPDGTFGPYDFVKVEDFCYPLDAEINYEYPADSYFIVGRVDNGNAYWGVVKGTTTVVPMGYQEIQTIWHPDGFKENQAIWKVKDGDKYGLLNKNGIPVIQITYDLIQKVEMYWYIEEYWVISKDKKYGLLNLYGDEVIPCQYGQEVAHFLQWDGLIQPKNPDGTLYCEGKNFIYREKNTFSRKDGGQYFVSTTTGQFGPFDEIVVGDETIIYRHGDQSGFINHGKKQFGTEGIHSGIIFGYGQKFLLFH